jgi:CDP-glycerol glycerophosphotransferase
MRETGYPRNDVMSRPDADDVRARVRQELGIPDGRTAVLYAPTWRDDLVFDHVGDQDFEVPIDLGAFTERLGADHVLLTRLHSMVAGRIAIPPGAPVVDVSDRAESAELYLAADMLVTDYSSAMFDFAVTGKPMVFYTYDLQHYRDDVRGFYFDLAEVAPGPLVVTSEELVEAIADSDVAASHLADRYAEFQRTFCPLEDGHATDRVLDLLFPPGDRAGRSTMERG